MIWKRYRKAREVNIKREIHNQFWPKKFIQASPLHFMENLNEHFDQPKNI